jgi:predicted MFS family arabinose efflux permease
MKGGMSMKTNIDLMKTNSSVSSKHSEYWWILVAMINLAAFLAFAKVSEIPPIIPLLSRDLNVSYQSLSLLMTSYTVTRLVGSFVVGWLSDRWGPNRVIALGLLFVGVFGFLPTLITNFGLIVACRVLLVLGAGGTLIAGMDAMTKMMPSRMSLGIGINDAAVSLGAGAAFLLTPILSHLYGWRWTLRMSSIASLILLIPLLYILSQRREVLNKGVSHKATATITYDESTMRMAIILLSIAMVLVYFQGYGIFTWIPAYLTDHLHYSSSEVGTISMFLGLLAAPSALIAGRLAKSFRSMAYVAASGALMTFFAVLLMINVQGWSKLVVAILVCLMTWGRTQAAVPILSMVAFTSRPGKTGKALGQVFAMGYIGATLSTYLGGYLVTRTREYDLAFTLYAFASLLAAVVIMVLGRWVKKPSKELQVDSRVGKYVPQPHTEP